MSAAIPEQLPPVGPAATEVRPASVAEPTGKYAFPRYVLVLAPLLWLLACVAGAFSAALPTLPHRAVIVLDGRGVDLCVVIAPKLVADDPTISMHYCTAERDLGETLPSDVEFIPTTVDWQEITASDVVNAATQPDVWFTIALGLIAMLFLVGFAQATGTIRAGLAASISVVFFGLLLFPLNFTARIPSDMRGELVSAWQLVLIFYFGTEGAVQALKVLRPGSNPAGDLNSAANRATD